MFRECLVENWNQRQMGQNLLFVLLTVKDKSSFFFILEMLFS